MKVFFGYGRTRQKDGQVMNRHFNPYVNTIHTSVGHARENMEVLVAEFDMNEKFIERDTPMKGSYDDVGNHKGVCEPLNVDNEGLCRTIKSQYYKNSRANFERDGSMAATGVVQSPSYRIRKLTPRECFRLMGITETDIDKIQRSGVSQSQQYKMAGNSIVVDCLYHLFRKMFCETGSEDIQLTLF